ncbi:MAG: nicotinamide-nucleotide amidohydrolase family protein [Microbacteriaceae bacterium]
MADAARDAAEGAGDAVEAAARDAAWIVAECSRRSITIGVAESLTGGLLTASIVAVPGASRVLAGGVVAYATGVKRSLLGVDAALLAERGAVDPEVARQLADRVRALVAVDGRPAQLGLGTTGVAGPDPQDGRPVGLAYVGLALGGRREAVRLRLGGSRSDIRSGVVAAALALARAALAAE